MQTLYSQLTAVLDQPSAEFIVAYRQGGGTADGSGNLDTSKFGKAVNTISTPLDLVGAANINLVSPNAGNSAGGGSAPGAGNTPGSGSTPGGEALPAAAAFRVAGARQGQGSP